MFIKKSILLFAFPLIFSSQKGEKGKLIIIAHREPEMMYGNIKQVIEIRLDSHTDVKSYRLDTTNFDKNTNPVRTEFSGDRGLRMLVHYQLSNDSSGKKTQIITYPNAIKDIFKYDNGGQLVRSRPNVSYHTSYIVGDDNEIIEAVLYNYKKIEIKEKYKYNVNGLLTELDFWSKLKEMNGRNYYRYLSVDKKGNWTKRIVIHDNKNSESKADTVLRKITYY